MVHCPARRIALIALVCGLTGLITNAQAGSDFEFNEPTGNVRSLIAELEEECRLHPNQLLNLAGVYGPPSKADNFRRACGQGLHGRGILGTPYKRLYHWQESRGGALEVFGVEKCLSFDSQHFGLVIGEITRIGRPHEQPEIRERQPYAAVLELPEKGGKPIWLFVDALGSDWNRPNPQVHAAKCHRALFLLYEAIYA